MDRRPDSERPEPGPRGREIGCGCVLPGSGLVLVSLIVGITALFVRVRVSLGR